LDKIALLECDISLKIIISIINFKKKKLKIGTLPSKHYTIVEEGHE